MGEGTAKFDAIKTETEELVAVWKKYWEDNNLKDSGLLQKLTFIYNFVFAVGAELVDVVEASLEVVNGSDKKATVVEAVSYAYYQIDPDLPWIPEPFESKLESWVLEVAVPALVDVLVAKYNEKNIFGEDPGRNQAATPEA